MNTELKTQIEKHNEWVKTLGKSGTCLHIEDAVFNELNLTDIDFSQAILPGTQFTNCVFKKNDLYATNLASAKFNLCKFEDTIFSKSNLDYSEITNCDFINCTFLKSSFYESSFLNSTFRVCDFKGSLFNEVEIRKCSFEDIDFEYCSFDKVNFADTKLKIVKGIHAISSGKINVFEGGNIRTFSSSEFENWLQNNS